MRHASPRGFLRTFIFTWTAGIVAVLAVAVYLNPWGNFGRSGFLRFYNVRKAKVEYLKSLPPERLPEVVVLGSSNVLRFRSQKITELWQRSAFNFGVFWGRAGDFLCIARFIVEDLDHRPQLFIVGMDTWTLHVDPTAHPIFPGVRRRLLNTPELASRHPDVNTAAIPWSRIIDAFSPQHFQQGMWRRKRSDGREPQASLVESTGFNTDGTRIKYYSAYRGTAKDIFPEVEAGTYPINEILKEARQEDHMHSLRTYEFDEFSPARLRQMEMFLKLCQRENISVVFLLNPVHPEFWERLNEMPEHVENLSALKQLLADYQREYPIVLGTVDATTIDKFGGDAMDFYDEIHPGTKNCNLMLELMDRQIRLP